MTRDESLLKYLLLRLSASVLFSLVDPFCVPEVTSSEEPFAVTVSFPLTTKNKHQKLKLDPNHLEGTLKSF